MGARFLIRLVLPVTLVTLLLAACNGGGATPTVVEKSLRILPAECQVPAGGQISLSLSGTLESDATVRWGASDGSILTSPPGWTSVFIAPAEVKKVTIIAYITTSVPGSPRTVERDCYVTTPMSSPTPAASPTSPATAPTAWTVVISEVMGFPCGTPDFKKWNQYVELYNYGDRPVDVNGLWLVDSGPGNRADRLVSWEARNPGVFVAPNVVTNTTVIPPRGFAVVLSPIYTRGEPPHRMPYSFASGTVILTIAEGDRLGDDVFGIVADGSLRDVMILYAGGQNAILEIISTYGTPQQPIQPYPDRLRDDLLDSVPLDLHECHSAERVGPMAADQAGNWVEIPPSPGEAPYR